MQSIETHARKSALVRWYFLVYDLQREQSNHVLELRKKTMTFLQDEGGASSLEYAVLGAIIVLGILAVLSTLKSKGK